MGIQTFDLNQDTIKEDKHKIIEEWLKDHVHEVIKCRWGIENSKSHY